MSFISVFTPTFNREKTLGQVFDCLRTQTYTFFEWIIVDDGSIDSTKELVEDFRKQKPFFKIIYYYQENKGKHIAINRGVELASGELFLIADSDDIFDENTLECFATKWSKFSENLEIGGIWCLSKDINGKIIGDEFPQKRDDLSYFEMQYTYKIKGEKWHIERTAILREFPFPEIEKGHGFYFGESYIWRRIYKKYKFVILNEPLRTYISSEDGIMSNMQNNSYRFETLRIGFLETLNEDISYFFYTPNTFIFQMSVYIYYSRMAEELDRNTIAKFNSKRSKLLFLICYPISFLLPHLFKIDKFKFFEWKIK